MITKKTATDRDRMETATLATVSKSEKVRSVFENAPHYLKRQGVDIRVRAETVRSFARSIHWKRMLDVGCGDGSISLPLLTPHSHCTLLDLSASMLAAAKGNIPDGLEANVDFQNVNFNKANLDGRSFDLIVSVGVLAHVDSPDEFISKLAALLRPDGSLIIEFTDARHLTGRLGRLIGSVKEIVAPPKYRTNLLSFGEVSQLFRRHHLKLVSAFRYATIPIPGIERILGHGMLYRMVSLIFGKWPRNRAAWLGNEYICLLTAN